MPLTTRKGLQESEPVSDVLRSLTGRSYLLLTFLAVVLPTGSVYGVNVKTISLGFFLVALAIYLVDRTQLWFSFRETIFILLTFAFLLLWTLVGILNPHTKPAEVMSHFSIISSTILIAWSGIFLIRKNVIKVESLLRTDVYAVFAMSCAKVLLTAIVVFYSADIVGGIESVFGQESFLPGGNIIEGLAISRIGFPSDIFCPLAFFVFLTPRIGGVRFGRPFSFIFCSVVLAAGFITYSRYVWFLFAVAIVAAFVVQKNWKMLSVAVLIMAASFFWFNEQVGMIYQDRFLSDQTADSDAIRTEQAHALTEGFAASPFLGKGIGASAHGTIRSETRPYSYELQWLAYLMQFGIIGMIGLLLLVAVAAKDLMMARHPGTIYVGIFFLLWLASGLTNPYLGSSFAGAIFAFFMGIFHRLRNQRSSAVCQSQLDSTHASGITV
jgi:hypothetical protein